MTIGKELNQNRECNNDIIDISIIVVQYNPVLQKLINTLASIIVQKGISFEIIISDDGSSVDYLEQSKRFLNEHGVTLYKFVKSDSNYGTVHNCLNGVKSAKGRYVKTISPGDYLYNEYTLKSIVDFMDKGGYEVVFGDAVYYSLESEGFKLYDVQAPSEVSIYNTDTYSLEKIRKNLLFYNDFILGASLVYKTDTLYNCLKILEGKIKYTEDISTALLAAKKIRIVHFDQLILWYEYGSGISTQKNEFWKEQLSKDHDNFYKLLRKEFKNNLFISRAYVLYNSSKIKWSFARKLIRFVVCPSRIFIKVENKLFNKQASVNKLSGELVNKLYFEKIIKNGGGESNPSN